MPRVQRYDRQVRQAAIPTVSGPPVPTAESYGAGIGQALATVGLRGVSVLMAEREQMQLEADQVAVLEASNKLGGWLRNRVDNPDNGIRTVQGKDAFGLPALVEEEYTKVSGELEATLSTDRQRLAFARVKASRLDDLRASVFGHVSAERKSFYAQQAKGGIELALADVQANAGDPALIGRAMARGEAILRDHLKGSAPELIASEVSKFQTTAHASVINQLLNNDRDQQASEYFAQVKEQMHGDGLEAAQKAVEAGTLRGGAQRASDAIIAAGGSLDEQRAKVRAIEDPKLRDEVQQRVEHEYSVTRQERDRQARESAAATLREAYNAAERGGLKAIPPAVWRSLDGSDRSAIRSYVEVKAGGGSIKTDMGTLTSLITLSSTDPAKFLQIDPMSLRNKLSDADLEQLARSQAALRTSGTTKDVFASEGLQNEVINAGLAQLGLNQSADDMRKDPTLVERTNNFRRLVREAVDREYGGKPTREQVQSVVDTLLVPTQKAADNWWPVPNTPARVAFDTPGVGVTSAADVPASVRRQMEEAWQKKNPGRAMPDAEVLRMFNAYLAKTRGGR